MKARIVAGNTGSGNVKHTNPRQLNQSIRFKLNALNLCSGVFKEDLQQFKAFVDIGSIDGLKTVEVGPGNLVLGN